MTRFLILTKSNEVVELQVVSFDGRVIYGTVSEGGGSKTLEELPLVAASSIKKRR